MLLVDDNEDFRKGVTAWLADETRIEIVGDARSGREALERVRELGPDLVLMDVSMPEIDGFEATRRMKADGEAPLVVLMTFYHSETARQEAWAAGADGFLSKASLTGELLGLVRNLLSLRLEASDTGSDRSDRRGLPQKAGVSAAAANDPDQLSPGLRPGSSFQGGRAPLISEEET
jgi:DNA-binding NarL/FixJ family response regulator